MNECKVYKLGNVDYHGARCAASIEWNLKDGPKGLCFAMSATLEEIGGRGRGAYLGGQCVDDVAGLFPEDQKAQAMLAVWKRWHLNDIRPGCAHQSTWTDRRIPVEDLPNSKANRDERGILAMWIRKDEHPAGLLCVPCPVCGYKYGSEWKFEQLPEAVVNEIKSWGG
jgi:hypothetical protein